VCRSLRVWETAGKSGERERGSVIFQGWNSSAEQLNRHDSSGFRVLGAGTLRRNSGAGTSVQIGGVNLLQIGSVFEVLELMCRSGV